MQSYARFYNKLKNLEIESKTLIFALNFEKEHEYNKKSQKNLEKGLFWVYICRRNRRSMTSLLCNS